ncbi:MAG: hypothetical protein DRP84_10765 [Spirochaetes bacterium]|nr:MAG: hypothetical protein DRP84_10765 [Spirochaetota bacterium]
MISHYINELVDSKTRATVLSIQNLAGRIFYAVITPFIGLAADIYSIIDALTIAGLTSLIIGSMLLLIFLKERQTSIKTL